MSRPQGYVFPEQAAMYRENPSGITWRVKKILAMALGQPAEVTDDPKARPETTPAEVRHRGDKYLAKLPEGKCERGGWGIRREQGKRVSLSERNGDGDGLSNCAGPAGWSERGCAVEGATGVIAGGAREWQSAGECAGLS